MRRRVGRAGVCERLAWAWLCLAPLACAQPSAAPTSKAVADECRPLDAGRAKRKFLASRVVAPLKESWQRAQGGRDASKRLLPARLAGWPERVLAERSALPADDEAFLLRLAHDTWMGIAAFTDREHGLPVDHVRLCGGSLDPADAEIGDYASGTTIGLHLAAIAGAFDLGLVAREEALARIRRALESLARMETHAGFFFNYYDTTTLERTSSFVSFVDAAWLSAGLILVRQSFPELYASASAFLDREDYGFFYDAKRRLMLHGFTVKRGRAKPARFHYGTLYTEARLGALLAIGRGEAPESLWFAMRRTPPPSLAWQRQPPQRRRAKEVRGHRFFGGVYRWREHAYVPSWGGSMFEALMPLLLLDERALAPRSLGRNDAVHVLVQRRFATEELGWPVWGLSPSAQPRALDYGEYGVPALGIVGYRPLVVTPHAAALALLVEPKEATANLRRLAERYDLYGEYGFYDAVDPATGEVAHAYLALDQSMTFLALVNHLRDGVLQRRFAADPAVAPALPMLAAEDFFD